MEPQLGDKRVAEAVQREVAAAEMETLEAQTHLQEQRHALALADAGQTQLRASDFLTRAETMRCRSASTGG